MVIPIIYYHDLSKEEQIQLAGSKCLQEVTNDLGRQCRERFFH